MSFCQTYDINMKLRPDQNKDSIQVLLTDNAGALRGRGHWHNLADFAGLLSAYLSGYITSGDTASMLAHFLERGNNLSDLTNTSTARTNLGLAIGTNVQAYDADLTTFAGITLGTNWSTALHNNNLANGWSTFFATPTSTFARSVMLDETGTGSMVFATSPTFITPILGAATATSLSISGQTQSGHFKHTSTITASTSITIVSTDNNMLTFTANGTKTAALPDATLSTVGDYYYIVNHSSSGTITVSAPGTSDTINGTLTILPGESATWECTDNNYWDHK